MNEIIRFGRLQEAIEWLQEDEVYTVYIKDGLFNDAYMIRIESNVQRVKVTISDVKHKKHVQFMLIDDEMPFFTSIFNDWFDKLKIE